MSVVITVILILLLCRYNPTLRHGPCSALSPFGNSGRKTNIRNPPPLFYKHGRTLEDEAGHQHMIQYIGRCICRFDALQDVSDIASDI